MDQGLLKEMLENAPHPAQPPVPAAGAGVRSVCWAWRSRPAGSGAGSGLLVILETDACFADGIEAATGCSVGHRTLRVEDYGKSAATFIDVQTEQALRVAPRLDVRQRAADCIPDESSRWKAMLQAYQVLSDEEMFCVQAVQLNRSLKEIISRPGVRVNCDLCGEEIINEREVRVDGRVCCLACAGQAYYTPVSLTGAVLHPTATVCTSVRTDPSTGQGHPWRFYTGEFQARWQTWA